MSLKALTRKLSMRDTGASGLRKYSDPTLTAMANAIEEEQSQTIGQMETRWIEEIEALRARLLTTEDTIEMIDYGARNSEATPTKEDMQGGVIIRREVRELSRASKGPKSARVLLRMVRELRPGNCLELGTCLGISAAYQSAGLTINGKGHLRTVEGAPALADKARIHLGELGLSNVSFDVGRFDDVLDRLLDGSTTWDWMFIDGHHDEAATVRYFNRLLPFITAEGVMVFDDIGWSDGMKRAWDAISRDSRVKLSVDLGSIGVCSKAPSLPKKLRLSART